MKIFLILHIVIFVLLGYLTYLTFYEDTETSIKNIDIHFRKIGNYIQYFALFGHVIFSFLTEI
jgi:hypothetical protein